MNETMKQIRERKSVRVFEDRGIEEGIKKEILQAAFEAPTAGNMMLYFILDITDKELKEKLAVLCDNQPFIAKASLVLVFLADYQRWYDTFVYEGCDPRTPGEGDILLACADAIIAAQNTVVAAESFGVGSCYIGDIIENYEEVKRVLNLPAYVLPAAMLVYGYPTEGQKNRKKPSRYEEEYIVHENTYKKLSQVEHRSMHEKREADSGHTDVNLTDKLQAFCKRKYMSEFCKEMNRSATEYLNNFR